MGAILHTSSGKVILGARVVRIGSASYNQLVFHDISVGSRHADIRPSGNGYSIMDLSSTSGTFVNEQRLYPNIPHKLHHMDQIRIGRVEVLYENLEQSLVVPTIYASLTSSISEGCPPTILAPNGAVQLSTLTPTSSGRELDQKQPPLHRQGDTIQAEILAASHQQEHAQRSSTHRLIKSPSAKPQGLIVLHESIVAFLGPLLSYLTMLLRRNRDTI
jgi:predicted component of type VI protein secretion system